MCRFLAYKGENLLLYDLLYRPKNSLINQSMQARERFDGPVNGDGFGLAWYDFSFDNTPGIFRDLTPAWNNKNLQYLTQKIRSPYIFAHVRASTSGDVSQLNCHPFHFNQFIFMHNGEIDGFDKIKRELRRKVHDDIYNWLQGQTDSEHFFALVMSFLREAGHETYTSDHVLEAFRQSIFFVEELLAKHQLSGLYLNAVLGDGRNMWGCRYVSPQGERPITMYYALINKNIVIVSEKLNDIASTWIEIPLNHFIIVGEDNLPQFIPISFPSTNSRE